MKREKSARVKRKVKKTEKGETERGYRGKG